MSRFILCVLGAMFALTAVPTDAQAAKKVKAENRKHHSSSSSSSSESCGCGC